MEYDLQVGSREWFTVPRNAKWATGQFALIRDVIANNYYTVREAFEAFDYDHDGTSFVCVVMTSQDTFRLRTLQKGLHSLDFS